MNHLAINGGAKLRTKYFPPQYSFKRDKKKYLKAIENILDKGVLSSYRGNSGPYFMGGDTVQTFEKMLSDKFHTNALAVNSCTSALWVACAAIDLRPGEEVIVTPWSMSCSASIPLLFGAIPIFADIDPDNFCLDPESVKKKITRKTRAIIYVDLFGGLGKIEEMKKLADDNGIFLIEDAAQAIGAHQLINGKKKFAGTIGHMGCFSFTQGKHLTAGEGGAICTNDSYFFERCSLFRNHAEAVVSDRDLKGEYEKLFNCDATGMNLRMTEIQAAIMIEQLNGLDRDISNRRSNVHAIEKEIDVFPFIKSIKYDCFNSYYVMPFLYLREGDLPHRNVFIDAVKAELTEEEGRKDRGILIGSGYTRPLYMMPVFQNRDHWAFDKAKTNKYRFGICPVCEKLQSDILCWTLYHGLNLSHKDISDITNSFYKIARWMEELK